MKKKRKVINHRDRVLYKRYCKLRFRLLLGLYLWEELSKLYAYTAPVLLVFGVLPKTAAIIATPIAILGSISAFAGKWYHLKQTKFRKRGFYEK